jgi:hypothetical protein
MLLYTFTWKTSKVCLKTFCHWGSVNQLLTTLSMLSPIFEKEAFYKKKSVSWKNSFALDRNFEEQKNYNLQRIFEAREGAGC